MTRAEAAEQKQLATETTAKAISDLLFFAKRVCGQKDLVDRPHRMMADFGMQPDPLKADKKRSIMLAPRSHAKSTLMTVCYPLWKLVRNPNERILIGSFTETRAQNFLKLIKSIIETPDDDFICNKENSPKMFNLLFGDWTRAKQLKEGWAKDAIQTIDWHTGKVIPFGNPHSIQAMGAGQQLASMHPTIAIFDDLVDDETKKSKAARQAAWDFCRLVEPLVDPGGEIWYIGTRYDSEDVYGYILDHLGAKYNLFQASIYGRPVIKPENHLVQVPAEIKDERINANFFWPQRFNVEIDDSLRETMDADHSPDYWSQYHNRPWADEKAQFKKELRRFFYLHEIYDEEKGKYRIPLHVVMTVDKNDEGVFNRDNAAYTVGGTSWEGKTYILEAEDGQWDWPETEQRIIHAYKRWPNISFLAVEAQRCRGLIQRSFYQTVAKMGAGYIPLFPFERKTHNSKNDRIKATLSPYSRGEILFLAEETPDGPVPVQKALLQEMDRWDPNSKTNKDNLLDTMADLFHPKLFHRPPAPTPDEDSLQVRVLAYREKNSPEAKAQKRRKRATSNRMRDIWNAPEIWC